MDSTHKPPGKTALVLSAGGMFGAYQAGAWQAIAERFRPDIVVGASVGSLNGWCIAGGCSPAELCARWRELNAANHTRWQWPRSRFDGLLDSTPVEQWAQDIHQAFQPRVGFGVVLTELRRLRPTLFQAPVSWQHLAASCGVPGLLRQYRLEGRVYSDGGLIESLPRWAALAMGATRLITVDVLLGRQQPWAMQRLGQFLQRWARPVARPLPAELEVITIEPPAPLGGARDVAYWNRDNMERWIDQGAQDAERAFARA